MRGSCALDYDELGESLRALKGMEMNNIEEVLDSTWHIFSIAFSSLHSLHLPISTPLPLKLISRYS